MAKRFSATEKWQDGWFTSLKPIEKLVFLYVVDNCDNAGFFEINSRLNSFIIGITEAEYITALRGLEKGFAWSKCGKRIFVIKFLFHQKNLPLNPENNAHKQILHLIEMNKESFEYDFDNLGANQGLVSPIGKGKGIGSINIEEKRNKIFELFKTKSSLPEWQITEEIEKYITWAEDKGVKDHAAAINKWIANVTPKITNPNQKRMVL